MVGTVATAWGTRAAALAVPGETADVSEGRPLRAASRTRLTPRLLLELRQRSIVLLLVLSLRRQMTYQSQKSKREQWPSEAVGRRLRWGEAHGYGRQTWIILELVQ